jgi:hypothetical protein
VCGHGCSAGGTCRPQLRTATKPAAVERIVSLFNPVPTPRWRGDDRLSDRFATEHVASGDFGRDQFAFSLLRCYQFAVSPSCNDDIESA